MNMDRLQVPTTDVATNEAGVPTTVPVAVSGPTRPEALHQDLSSVSPVSGVPISVLGATSVDWLQLLAASMQRAPNNVTAQARLRATNVVESASRPKAKETARARKLRVVGSDRASGMQKKALPGASGMSVSVFEQKSDRL